MRGDSRCEEKSRAKKIGKPTERKVSTRLAIYAVSASNELDKGKKKPTRSRLRVALGIESAPSPMKKDRVTLIDRVQMWVQE
jgi:hypothetical protein